MEGMLITYGNNIRKRRRGRNIRKRRRGRNRFYIPSQIIIISIYGISIYEPRVIHLLFIA